MNWDGPILTDSGGYQVFSLGREPEARQVPKDQGPRHKTGGQAGTRDQRPKTKLAKVTDEGVQFQSHVDGSTHWMTPESSIEIQEALGADIIMVFDECLAHPATFDQTKKSMERSIAWEKRSLAAKTNGDQALFAIIQGGMFPELRKECTDRLMAINAPRSPLPAPRFSGFAIGGLSVGEPSSQLYEMASSCAGLIPDGYPRYLMGVGMPEDIIRCIDFGYDLFDCVIPTRNARNGMLFKQGGFIQIKQAQYTEDPNPVDKNCGCHTCRNYSRAYLRHLHMAKEILSSVLSSIHNLHYYFNLLNGARSAIKNGTFGDFKKSFFSHIANH